MSESELTKNVWPDQWFVSDGTKIQGPLSAEETFSARNKISELFSELDSTQLESRILVSRKGFTKWYEYRELHNLYLNGRVSSNTIVANLRSEILNELDRMKTLLPNPTEKESIALQKALESNDLTRLKKPSVQPVPTRQVEDEDLYFSKLKSEERLPFKPSSNAPSQNTIEYLHMMNRGRLRLGSLRSPVMAALSSCFIFTIPGWAQNFRDELHWHLDHANFKKSSANTWFSLIPFIHFIIFYQLSAVMLAAELQNNYRSVSTYKALILSFFPPLAIFYLERAAQKHWRSHLMHIQRKNEKAKR
jgi:hypothetical protein